MIEDKKYEVEAIMNCAIYNKVAKRTIIRIILLIIMKMILKK